MKRFAIVFLFVAACGGKSATPATPEGTGGDEVDTGSNLEVVTLTALENGDRACYVVFTRADGTEGSQEGDFDLCEGGAKDATSLIGQQITFTTVQANVQAASCEGDPDCGESDRVDLVDSITAAP